MFENMILKVREMLVKHIAIMFNPPSIRVNEANIIDGSSIVNHE